MSALKPIVFKLENKNIPHTLAAIIVFFSAIVVLGGLLSLVVPTIASESILFLKDLPYLVEHSVPFFKGTFNLNSLVQFLPDFTSNIFKVATGVFSNFLFLITVAFFTFYFLLEERLLQSFVSRFFETSRARKIVLTIRKIEGRMGAWMRAELILMTVIGLLVYVGLSILGIKFALSLAVLAGLLEIVPIIGPIIATVPAFLVASSVSLWMGGITIIMYIIVQQLENNVIVPYIMNKAVGIHPITTLVALSIGGKLGGIIGAVLAVPVALLIETIIVEVVSERK
jgi:predicted PurR-regulated permease PerM